MGSRNGKRFKQLTSGMPNFLATFLKNVYLFSPTLSPKHTPLPRYVHYLSAFKIFKITFVDVSF